MPDLTFDQKFKKLPPFVQEWMAEESANINGEIAKKYGLGSEDTRKMVWVISHTIIGDIELEEFLEKLKERLPNLDDKILRQMALDIAIRRFYPLRDFLKGVEALVKNLGGEVPTDAPLYSQTYEEKVRSPKDEGGSKEGTRSDEQIVYVNVKDVLEKYHSVENQFITSKPIKLKDKEEPVSATLSNWLRDYREHQGPPPHSGMERTDFLFKSENAKVLDNSERTILGNVLKAYDEGGELPIDKKSGKIILSELFRQGIVPNVNASRKPQPSSQKQNLPPKGNVVDLRRQNTD